MIGTLLAWSVFVIGVASALVCGFAGTAAWGDAQHVCPDGNQCSDAVSTMLLGAIVLAVGSVVNIVTLRIISPRAKRQAAEPMRVPLGGLAAGSLDGTVI